MGRIVLAVVLAVGITTALDASGYSAFSALPLIPLFVGFALLDRIPREELGLTLGGTDHYSLALAHPLLVMAALAALAQAFGALDLHGFDLGPTARDVAIVAGATFVMAIVTEEGFFRGWLWAAIARRGAAPVVTLAVTSLAFLAWHLSFALISADFHFVPAQVPVFLLNVMLLGVIWGLLRLGSGSIVVSSAGHGLWNGLAYVLFGVGDRVGELGIKDIGIFGPEVGVLGACLNAGFAVLLCWLYRDKLWAQPAPVPAAA